jgi:hypothetical protein
MPAKTLSVAGISAERTHAKMILMTFMVEAMVEFPVSPARIRAGNPHQR